MQGLESLKAVIGKVDEILRYRVEANLIAIAEAPLINLIAGHALSCEEILADQTEYLIKQTDLLAKR